MTAQRIGSREQRFHRCHLLRSAVRGAYGDRVLKRGPPSHRSRTWRASTTRWKATCSILRASPRSLAVPGNLPSRRSEPVWVEDRSEFHNVNVGRRPKHAEACLEHRVQKLVHKSSCITLGALGDPDAPR